MSSKRFCKLLIAFATGSFVMAIHAQDAFPSRPITMIVPFPVGSGTDIGARMLAKDMGAALESPVVVDNKPGANGAIAAQAAARAKPDGYTLFIGNATTNAANYAFFPGKLGYTPATFEAVGGLGISPISLYVAAQAPWRDLRELMGEARTQPGKFNCGSGNATTQVACVLLTKMAGVDIVNVPYKGNPQSLADVAGGQLSFAFSDSTAATSFVEARRVRALAVASRERNPVMPDAATFIEQGFPGYEIAGWSMVFAPAGLPVVIAERLNAVIRKSVASPASMEVRARSGGIALQMSVAQSRAFVADEVARWARFVELTGVKPGQ